MAHIQTGNGYPGIVSLLYYKSSTGKALSKLAHTLLKGPSPLTSGERELIASYVSKLNECKFCCNSHSAAAAHHLNSMPLVEQVIADPVNAPVSSKMKALLVIAGEVQKSGTRVLPRHIEEAKKNGATDEEIHDAVLVAAAFCMYNRYVDGLGTHEPEKFEDYDEWGQRLSSKGYKYPPFFIRWMVRRILNKKYPLKK
jgi:uncharacterized peroxidase-related enzyme